MNGKAQAGLRSRRKGVEGWKVKDMFKLSQFPFFIVLSQKFYQEISLLFHWLDLKEINAGEPGKYSPIHLHTNARIH